MRKQLLAAVMALAWSVALTGGANATLLTLSPTVDGDAGSIGGFTIINAGSSFLRATTFGEEFRSALEFDISAIPSGVVVVSATLNLFTIEADENIGVHGYTGNGTLEAGDFNLSNEITQFDPEPANVVDVTSFIQDQYSADSQFAGFQLRELLSNDETLFVSSESFDTVRRPFLEIEYESAAVPEPATLAVFGLGLAGLGFARRRRAD